MIFLAVDAMMVRAMIPTTKRKKTRRRKRKKRKRKRKGKACILWRENRNLRVQNAEISRRNKMRGRTKLEAQTRTAKAMMAMT
jgi:hypothetical protein